MNKEGEFTYERVTYSHVVVQPAGNGNVSERRWARIAGNDVNHVDCAHFSVRDGSLDSLEVGVESALEGYHAESVVLLNRTHDIVDNREIQRNWLLAEAVLAVAGAGNQLLRVLR